MSQDNSPKKVLKRKPLQPADPSVEPEARAAYQEHYKSCFDTGKVPSHFGTFYKSWKKKQEKEAEKKEAEAARLAPESPSKMLRKLLVKQEENNKILAKIHADLGKYIADDDDDYSDDDAGVEEEEEEEDDDVIEVDPPKKAKRLSLESDEEDEGEEE